MNRFCRLFLLCLSAAPVSFVSLLAGDPDDKEIERLVKQLDSEEFAERQAATKRLTEIGTCVTFFSGMNVPFPVPLIFLCLGGLGSLLTGIPWAHTQGRRGLKIAYLGPVGFAGGGTAGLFLAEAAGPTGDRNLGTAIGIVLVGFWIGAILLGSLGLWWGLSFHR